MGILGTFFNYNNRFTKAQKHQCAAARKATFALLNQVRRLDLPIDIAIELFVKCVHPILLYGCEVWAFESLEICEKLQLKFMKLLIKVKNTTPTCMVLGELGIYPISVEAHSRLLNFWYKMCLESITNTSKISVLLFTLSYSLFRQSQLKLSWLTAVHTLLDNLGLSYIWMNLPFVHLSLNQFKLLVKQRLRDQYIQNWRTNIDGNSLCVNYKLFKNTFCLEKISDYSPTHF